MSDYYVLSKQYNKDKATLVNFTQFASQLAEKYKTPEAIPIIIQILWERRMEFELMDTSGPESFDDVLNGLKR